MNCFDNLHRISSIFAELLQRKKQDNKYVLIKLLQPLTKLAISFIIKEKCCPVDPPTVCCSGYHPWILKLVGLEIFGLVLISLNTKTNMIKFIFLQYFLQVLLK